MTCLIPARGGSKGIHRKNLVEFLGKPLIQHTIEPALEVFGEVIVSTDCPDIADLSRDLGCRVLDRPRELATDTANLRDVAIHARDGYSITDDLFVLLPTYPDRTPEQLADFVKMWQVRRTYSDSMLCGIEADDHPYLCVVPDGLVHHTFGKLEWRRQDRPEAIRIYHQYVAVCPKRLELLDDGFFNDTTAIFPLKRRPTDIDTHLDLFNAKNNA